MTFTLKDLREMIHSCFPESQLEAYIDKGISGIEIKLKDLKKFRSVALNPNYWDEAIRQVEGILG